MGRADPPRAPLIGGRDLPTWLVAGIATAGVAPLAAIVWLSIVNWDLLIGAAGRPTTGWTMLATACYLPAALWPILVTAVTFAYVRRRTAD